MEQLDLFGNRIDKTMEAKRLLEKRMVSKPNENEIYNDVIAIAENYESELLPPEAKQAIEGKHGIEGKQAIKDKPVKEGKVLFTAEEKRAILSRPGVIRSINPIVFEDDGVAVRVKSRSSAGDPLLKGDNKNLSSSSPKRGRKSFKDMDAEVDLIEVPEDEVLFQKHYYSISQVAEWFKVNTSLIRFWENEFDVLKPKKNRKGDRLFRPEDVKNLHLIYNLLRERKYSIEGAKEYMKTNKGKGDLQMKVANSLKQIKGFLVDLKASLQ